MLTDRMLATQHQIPTLIDSPTVLLRAISHMRLVPDGEVCYANLSLLEPVIVMPWVEAHSNA